MSFLFGDGAAAPVYPTYIENLHKWMLTGDLTAGGEVFEGEPSDQNYHSFALAMLADVGTADDPWYGKGLYDPAPELGDSLSPGAVGDRYDEYDGHVRALDLFGAHTPVSWDRLLEKAKGQADAIFNLDSEIDGLVDAHASKADEALASSLNPYTASMWESRASQNSQFAVGLGLLYADRNRNLDAFRANLVLQQAARADAWIPNAVSQMMQYLQMELQVELQSTAFRMDLSKARVISQTDYMDQELQRALEQFYFPMDILDRHGAGVGMVSGVQPIPSNRVSKGQAALAGVMNGASMGIPLAMTGNPLGIAAAVAMPVLFGAMGYISGGY